MTAWFRMNSASFKSGPGSRVSELQVLVEQVGREREAELGGVAAVEAAHDPGAGRADADRGADLELDVGGYKIPKFPLSEENVRDYTVFHQLEQSYPKRQVSDEAKD